MPDVEMFLNNCPDISVGPVEDDGKDLLCTVCTEILKIDKLHPGAPSEH